MPVTMLRFNIVEGIGPVLQIAEGWTAERLHHVVALGIHAGTGTIQSCRAGIDEMNKAVGGNAVRLLPGHTLAGFGAPVGAHIMEARCRTGNKAAQHHGNTVEGAGMGARELQRGL